MCLVKKSYLSTLAKGICGCTSCWLPTCFKSDFRVCSSCLHLHRSDSWMHSLCRQPQQWYCNKVGVLICLLALIIIPVFSIVFNDKGWKFYHTFVVSVALSVLITPKSLCLYCSWVLTDRICLTVVSSCSYICPLPLSPSALSDDCAVLAEQWTGPSMVTSISHTGTTLLYHSMAVVHLETGMFYLSFQPSYLWRMSSRIIDSAYMANSHLFALYSYTYVCCLSRHKPSKQEAHAA